MNITGDKGYGSCDRCGLPADKFSSGVPECWPCWNYRKLDRPAAKYWARVTDDILSNVDLYDLGTYFAKCGVSQADASTMLETVHKIREHSKRLVENGQPLVNLLKGEW